MSPSKKSPSVRKNAPAPTAVPTPEALASALGVTLTPRLDPGRIVRFRKPLPGYVALLDDAAALLAQEDTLAIPDVTPEALRAIHARQSDLVQREAVAETVYRSVYEQRLEVDDRAMGMLQKIARRVMALAEDDPSMPTRWRALLDYFAAFRPGPNPKPPPADKVA